MLERFCEMQAEDNFLNHGLSISALENVIKLKSCSCVLLVFIKLIEYVNITTPERFCTVYGKCKFLSMGYISAFTQAS